MIKKPIILLGSGRSGTTLLGKLFEQHPEVAYWVEPRPIWMHGNAYRGDHELDAGHLSPRIGRWIDARFGRFLEEAGKSRFAEKTPSNCLRMPFIHALYPDCRMIHIIRDGRSVVRSMLEIQEKPPNQGIFSSRLRQTAIWEWPAYIPMFYQTMWRTKFLGKRSTYWGTKPHDWRDWVDCPPHLQAAYQWKTLVEKAMEHGRVLPEENYLEIRFERLMKEPKVVIEKMLDFVELSCDPGMVGYAEEVIDPSRGLPQKMALENEEEVAMMELIGPLLGKLGYLDENKGQVG